MTPFSGSVGRSESGQLSGDLITQNRGDADWLPGNPTPNGSENWGRLMSVQAEGPDTGWEK
jgi:hypothetical protein